MTVERADDLAMQMAAFDAAMQDFKLNNEELSAKVARLEQRDAPCPPVTLVALKSALPAGLCYETARSWCERGYAIAEKQGGRWLVNVESLNAVRASRIKRAA